MKDLANKLNPAVRGWIEYYGAFFQSELIFLMYHLDKLIYRWVIRKYKKQGSNFKKAENWVKRIKRMALNYFVHWSLLRAWPNDKSRMNREIHVRFREKLGGRFPLLTRPMRCS